MGGAPILVVAVQVLASFHPRLILMDLQMPRVDGYELTRKLKADAATQDILIIALTALAIGGDEERARAAGCDGYLAKPFNLQSLSELLAKSIGAGSDGSAVVGAVG